MQVDPITRTVSQMAALTGVTVRTLHHFDELKVLSPSQRGEGGRRLYTNEDLARLREVLTWRRLGVPLKEIAELIDNPDADRRAVLRAQRDAVERQRHELDELAEALDAALATDETPEERAVKDKAIIDALDGFDPAEYEAEAAERWGDTDAYRQSSERTKNYTPDDWSKIRAEFDEIHNELADLFGNGEAADSPAVTTAVQRHREHITRRYYDCTPEIHAGLGELYVADPRFRESIERGDSLPGFAEWLRDAFTENALRQMS